MTENERSAYQRGQMEMRRRALEVVANTIPEEDWLYGGPEVGSYSEQEGADSVLDRVGEALLKLEIK